MTWSQPGVSPLAAQRLEALRSRPQEAALLLDFDGTLSEIAERPEDARPVEGAAEVLEDLAASYRTVAIVTGRPAMMASALLGARSVRYCGLYGLEELTPAGAVSVEHVPLPHEIRALAEEAAAAVPETRVEPKGSTIAVHYRQAADGAAARRALIELLAPARSAGFELIEGKKVVELVPAGWPRKGGVVRRLLDDRQLHAALYAGDDLADIEAFTELDRAAERGVSTLKVAVRSLGTPAALTEAADLVAAGPPGLLGLLRGLL